MTGCTELARLTMAEHNAFESWRHFRAYRLSIDHASAEFEKLETTLNDLHAQAYEALARAKAEGRDD